VNRSWGSTPTWRRIRRQVLDRDGHQCQLRLDGCTGRADEVHHRYGRVTPGQPLNSSDYDPALLVAACQNCNRKIRLPADPPARPRTNW
jgi:5-methylcytosine-specific restriction endonuclease McrA